MFIIPTVSPMRTSIPIDKETPVSLYRTSGYRVCGERAVRVDILERLADLIRPALAWREGVQTAKPDEFYSSVVDAAVEAGVSEMYSPDENLESVFKYLVAR